MTGEVNDELLSTSSVSFTTWPKIVAKFFAWSVSFSLQVYRNSRDQHYVTRRWWVVTKATLAETGTYSQDFYRADIDY